MKSFSPLREGTKSFSRGRFWLQRVTTRREDTVGGGTKRATELSALHP